MSIAASSTGFAYFDVSASACFASVIEPTTANTNSFVGLVRIATYPPLRRLPSSVQQFVAADGFDASRRARHQAIDSLGILLAPAIVEIRPESEALSLRVDLDAAGRSKLLLAKNKMAENEKATSWPFDRNAPLHGGFVAGNGR